jgi:hypothetical protein
LITPEAGPIAEAAGAVRRQVCIIRGERDVTAMLEAAGRLVDDPAAPFCTRSLWLSAWYRSFRAAPVAVCVLEDEVPVGMACLAIRRKGPMHTVTLAGHGPSDYGRLPARDADVAADLAMGIVDLLASLGGPWRIVLDQLPVADPVAMTVFQLLAGARLEPAQASPHLTFGDDRRLERVLSGGTRREARRGQTRLREAGVTVQVRRIADPAGVAAALPQIVAVHRARDHAVGRRSDLDPRSSRAFFDDVVGGLARTGTLDLWMMLLDGEIGAYFVGVRDGASYRIMDGRMSGLWPSASPALILRHEMTAALLAEPSISDIDYMRGVLAHKTQDASRVVPAERLLAESAPWVARGVRGWHRLKSGIRDRMPSTTRRWVALARSRFAAGRTDHRVQRRP